MLYFLAMPIVQAQEKAQVKYFARDQFIIDLNYNHLFDQENTLQQKWNSFGFNVAAMYNILGKYSNVCFATGFGISAENINLETQPVTVSGKTVFNAIPANIDYKKNKIALTYIDIPAEIRFRTNPNEKRKSFKIYIGGKFSYLINNYLKYIGEELNTGKWVKYKTYWLPNISLYRYGLTCRIGFGKLNLSAYYALNPLFEKEKSDEIYPVQLGLSLFLF